MNAVIDSQSSDVGAGEISKLLKAAGDGLRLQILVVLSRNAFGVLELCQILDIKQSAMSHHLKTLAQAGLLTTRREGNTIYYRRSDEPLAASLVILRNSIFDCADRVKLDEEVSDRLNAIFQTRAKAAQQFFVDNADAFKEQQDLIAEFSVYGPEVESLLDQSQIPSKAHVLEVGPGTGEFLPALSQRFNRVTALDLSQTMLDQSRALCVEHQCGNVSFVHDDTGFCESVVGELDCVVINMVLHHTPSPSQIFEDVAKALKDSGVLIICELTQHDQDWVKEACGDVWLGFASNELKTWAKTCGFVSGIDRYFALKNGFQIQIHQFIKSNKV